MSGPTVRSGLLPYCEGRGRPASDRADSSGTDPIAVVSATGVGDYTVQIAGSRGAHVIATVRGDVDEARGLGAEEVYDTKAVAVVDALRASHPDGVDAVLDLVNGSDAIRRDAEIQVRRQPRVDALRGRRKVVR